VICRFPIVHHPVINNDYFVTCHSQSGCGSVDPNLAASALSQDHIGGKSGTLFMLKTSTLSNSRIHAGVEQVLVDTDAAL
jgi:hypothetical protein